MTGSTPRRRGGALLAAAFAAVLFPHPGTAQTLTLQAASDAALASHPSVMAANARLDGARASRAGVRAAFLPSVMGSTGLTRFEEPMVVAPLHGFDPTNPPDFDRTLIQSQIGMEYTLFDGGGRHAAARGAQAAEEGTDQLREATEQDLLQAVAAAYTGVLATRAMREAAVRQVEALTSEAERARLRLQEGTAARVEVLRAEAALLDALAQRASAEAGAALAERGLARIMGTDPSAVSGQTLSDIQPRPTGATSGVEADDPRVEAARRNVDGARARVGQARAGRLPTLKATAGLLNFGSGQGEYVTEWQAGVRVSLPLFTGGARSAAIRRAEADLRVAEEELRLTELGVAAELDAARAALSEASARARALGASVAQWEEVARIEVLSLETGAGVQQDYLRAEAALFHARAGQARARYDEILAHVGQARSQGRLDRVWIDDALEIRR